MSKNRILYQGAPLPISADWNGETEAIAFEGPGVVHNLLELNRPCFLLRRNGEIGVTVNGDLVPAGEEGAASEVLCRLPPLLPESFGDPGFLDWHGCRYPYYAGSMAHAISSEEMVINLGKQGVLAAYGAGGVLPSVLEQAIQRVQQALPSGPYAFNLIHNPFAEAMERSAMQLYLKHGVRTVEASAYMDLTPYIVQYRVAGLSRDHQGGIVVQNRVIAKLSRREVAAKFLSPAPENILRELVSQGAVTTEQAEMAAGVPMADDITVEADSGGHTDNQPLVSLLPSMLALRDQLQDRFQYPRPVRIGAAGGIGTPASALAAFAMGAAYIVTGSVNQACLEAGSSAQVKQLLAETEMADVIMAPAFDMFEMGGRLQVSKRGTLFPMRANKLHEIYQSYGGIEQIPAAEKEKLEKQFFRKSLEEVWRETITYFNQRDPEQIRKAEANPRKKMALIFRWYLGLASHWANQGEKGREMDYQIWCGPAMGAFNDWVRGSYLEDPSRRRVYDVAHHLLTGAAYLCRLHLLKISGFQLPITLSRYVPRPL